MLKALVKKQFMEMFRGYLINKKTNTARSRGKLCLLFVLFGVLMLIMCALFAGLALLLADGMFQADMAWLYFTLMGIMSVMFGTFGSVFNTYAGLYLAKDNDLLLSMPIPPRAILTSRLIGVYGMALLYSGSVWLPTIVVAWIVGTCSVLSVIFDVLLIFVIAAFVAVITCLLGWAVAAIASRLKNKSIVTVLVSLVFFGLYYFVCFHITDFITSLITNSEQVGKAIQTWAKLLTSLGEAANGRVSSMMIFTGITILLSVLCGYIMSRTFYSIVTRAVSHGRKKEYRVKQGTQRGANKALLMREVKRFTASPTYMLNCGLGLILAPVAAIFLLIKQDFVQALQTVLQNEGGVVAHLMLPGVLALLGWILAMNLISTPSVSLEGKSLWILRSLPVTAKKILHAKLNLHVILNLIPAVVSAILVAIAIGASVVQALLMVLFMALFCLFTGVSGLIIGTTRPDFNWTNESYPIKQSTNILFSMMLGWLSAFLFSGVCLLLSLVVSETLALLAAVAVLGGVTAGSMCLLDTKVQRRFEAL